MCSLKARVLGVERVHGVNRQTGEVYDFRVVHVLDGYKSRELRVPEDYDGPAPLAEDVAVMEVRPVVVQPAGGRPFLRWDFVRLLDDEPAVDAARAA